MYNNSCKCGCDQFVYWMEDQGLFSRGVDWGFYDPRRHPQAACLRCNRSVKETNLARRFENVVGHPNPDDILVSELEMAGINAQKHEFMRKLPGEVKTAVRGSLFGWCFTRVWCYWICEGPGINVDTAERLHKSHGEVVRVDGHCGSPNPRDQHHGLACGKYHVDSPDGLKALADAIKGLVEESEHVVKFRKEDAK
jgi:hypothetical protein